MNRTIKNILLFSLVFISGGCGLVTDGINYANLNEPRYFSQANDNISQEFDGTLKVVSYNIKFSKKIDKALELLEGLDELKHADIIFLQEMDEAGVQRIADALHYNYVYYPAVKHPLYNRNFGNAIVTKWPIVYDQKVILPHLDPEKLQRIAVGAVLKVGAKYVMAYSVHMRIWLHPFQRKNQMSRLLNSIPSYFDHCIIAGDFNTFTTFNRTVIFESFDEHNFKLATENVDWTYKHWYMFNKKSLMDYIFVRNFNTLGAGRVSSRKASDHLPIWTELKFRELN